MTNTLHHWAAGAVLDNSPERFADVTDPDTGSTTKRVALATPADAENVIRTAKRH